MLENLSQFLLLLYAHCAEERPDHFLDWVFRHSQGYLEFDAGFWGSGSCSEEGVGLNSAFIFNKPHECIADFLKENDSDELVRKIASLPSGQTIALDCDALRETPAYARFLHPYGIEQILTTYVRDPDTDLYDHVSFYRSDPDRPFTEKERLFVQQLVPHLMQAVVQNRMQRVFTAGRAANEEAALCDTQGLLRMVTPGLAALLRTEWASWRGARLPVPLRELQADGIERFVTADIAATAELLEDLKVVRVRMRHPLDNLSSRENEIARDFASGLSHKQIALKHQLSPATVRNHLSRIYEKLGIGGKAQLTEIVLTAPAGSSAGIKKDS